MPTGKQRIIVVTGATGRQGSAVARHLLLDGWHVRALTRNAQSTPAKALAALGAAVVQGNMDDAASLPSIFAGAYGVYSVQTPYLHGPEAEVRQGKNIADVAKAAGVRHVVYGSAGIGKQQTGIPSWDSKQHIEAHMQALELPLTILRPMAFMELMTDKQFYPAVSTWHVMPTLMGESRKVGWLCTEDLGIIAANVFADPDRFVGQDFCLTSDTQSVEECRTIYRRVMGKNPPRFPMPIWMFERLGFVSRDLSRMWRWLRTATIDLKPDATYAIHPGALRVEDWLPQQNR